MEINENLKNYIKIFDDVLPKHSLENLLKICKESKNFEKAQVIGNNQTQVIDEKIRRTNSWPMHNVGVKSLTEVHWTNLLNFIFSKSIEEYQKFFFHCGLPNIIDIQILKYNEGGFYNFHIDHGSQISRTLSCIFLINDDYEGGELCFNFNKSSEDFMIEKKKNRLIVWPSNFLYPHAVKPTKKGTRYSVVAWAL